MDGNNCIAGEQWQDTVSLLRQVRSHYQITREQLGKISQALADYEGLVSQSLQDSDHTYQGYGIMCLMPGNPDPIANQMGRTVLGGKLSAAISPPKMRLQVNCLGTFNVRSSAKQVQHWQSLRAKSVFEYLITRHNAPVTKDILVENLWSDCGAQAASNNLKTAVHVLRQTLSHLFDYADNIPCVIFSQGGYLINPKIELVIDAEEFERHWIQGRRLERNGKMAEAIREFEMAEESAPGG